VVGFEGFPPDGLQFLDELSRNNNKAWFDAHRGDFDEYLMAPAKDLVVDLGMQLQERVSSRINVEPRVNGSIMRMNRDIRFSRDKTPYKTWLGLWFWEGKGRSMDCAGCYFGLSAHELTLGAGKHGFDPAMLGRYRSAVADPAMGAELVTALEAIQRSGSYEIGGQHYKQVPPGFDRGQARAALLLHNALHASVTLPIPEELHTSAFAGFCLGHYVTLAPLHRWLVKVIGGGTPSQLDEGLPVEDASPSP